MSAQDIHNISFLGYYDTEKITLLESVAHHFGAILRQGVVTDGLNNRRGQILRMDTEGGVSSNHSSSSIGEGA